VLFSFCKENLHLHDFSEEIPKQLYKTVLEKWEVSETPDFLSFATELDTEGASSILEELLSRKVIPEKALMTVYEIVKKMKERNWLKTREELHQKLTEERDALKQMELVRVMGELSKTPPCIPNPCDREAEDL
jgi:hypothetical protein